MDRDRLKQVHQTEVSESRLNEDFILWLRTKGPSWLLMALIAVGVYMGLLRWKQHKRAYVEQGWTAFLEARLPGSFEDVAERYADIPGLPLQAKRQAADTLLRAVQAGRALGADPTLTDLPLTLTDEQRLEYLDRADRLFLAVLEADDQSLAMTLHAVSALNGRAVVAESRGDLEPAGSLYERAARRAEPYYPELAQRALARAARVGDYAQTVSLPTREQLPDQPEPESLEPVAIEEVLRDLLPAVEVGGG